MVAASRVKKSTLPFNLAAYQPEAYLRQVKGMLGHQQLTRRVEKTQTDAEMASRGRRRVKMKLENFHAEQLYCSF